MKAIIQADLRDITDKYDRKEISYSKMNELINDKADDFAIRVLSWYDNLQEIFYRDKDLSYKELLQIYKKEKGL